MLDWDASGMSVMEGSHRGKAFRKVAAEAEADLRELLAVPGNYRVLFLQGGASAQFAFVPLNLATAGFDGRLRKHRTLVAKGDRGGAALLPRARSGRCRRCARPAAKRVALERQCDVCALHTQRNHQRGRVWLCSRCAGRDAGRRHVFQHSVAAHRCGELWTHLCRRAKEHWAPRV